MKPLFNKNSECPAFTLIEFLMVAFIVIILSVIVVVNYEFGGYEYTLRRSARTLAQDIRKAQEMSMSAQRYGGIVPPGGYGICINHSDMKLIAPDPPPPPPGDFSNNWDPVDGKAKEYILFADMNDSGIFDSGDEIIDTMHLEDNIYVWETCIEGGCKKFLSITFRPPNPDIFFNGDPDNDADLKVWSEKIDGEVVIIINRAGLIEVEENF